MKNYQNARIFMIFARKIRGHHLSHQCNFVFYFFKILFRLVLHSLIVTAFIVKRCRPFCRWRYRKLCCKLCVNFAVIALKYFPDFFFGGGSRGHVPPSPTPMPGNNIGCKSRSRINNLCLLTCRIFRYRLYYS